MKRSIGLIAVLAILAFGVTSAHAVSSYLSNFESTYPVAAGSVIDTCSLCHASLSTYARNVYGSAFASAGHSFTAIQAADSDGDGFSNLAEINAKTFPGDPNSHPAGTPSPAACSSFTYSSWGTCQSSGTQTRTVTLSSPAGCTGGTPVTSQSCTYVPPVPGTCTYTYSAWGACQSSGIQTRTVSSSTPAGCTGTPMTSQSCTPPVTPPTTGTMPLPKGQMAFTYDAVPSPVVSADPSKAKPIGVGSVATGGNTFDVNVNVGPFEGTVNITLSEYVSAYRLRTVYTMDSENRMRPASRDSGFWKTNVTGVNQHAFGPIPVSTLRKGFYVLTLAVKPSGSRDGEEDEDEDSYSGSNNNNNRNYYQWTTHFTIR